MIWTEGDVKRELARIKAWAERCLEEEEAREFGGDMVVVRRLRHLLKSMGGD